MIGTSALVVLLGVVAAPPEIHVTLPDSLSVTPDDHASRFVVRLGRAGEQLVEVAGCSGALPTYGICSSADGAWYRGPGRYLAVLEVFKGERRVWDARTEVALQAGAVDVDWNVRRQRAVDVARVAYAAPAYLALSSELVPDRYGTPTPHRRLQTTLETGKSTGLHIETQDGRPVGALVRLEEGRSGRYPLRFKCSMGHGPAAVESLGSKIVYVANHGRWDAFIAPGTYRVDVFLQACDEAGSKCGRWFRVSEQFVVPEAPLTTVY